MPPDRHDDTAPTHVPSARELDDLELLCKGALTPLTGFDGPDGLVTLHVPADLAAAAVAADALVLTDPEGAALARMVPEATYPVGERRVGLIGDVEPLAHDGIGPFRRFRLSPEEVRQRCGDDFLTVPVEAPLTLEDLRLVEGKAGLGPLVLLVLLGAGEPGLRPAALVRATVAAAGLLSDAHVIVVPVAPRGSAGCDDLFVRRVVDSYAVRGVVWPLGHGELPFEVSAVVAEATPTGDHRGMVLFFTGFSGSGKSTLARAVQDFILEQYDRTVTSLDGDVVRRNLSAGLGFSAEDRDTNIRRIGWVAAEIGRHGGIAIASPIAPFDATRKHVRALVAEAGASFALIHVATSLQECERRDRKGLYALARAGELPHFTGISSPYEVPDDAEVRVDTTGLSVAEARDVVLAHLYEQGHLSKKSSDMSGPSRSPDRSK